MLWNTCRRSVTWEGSCGIVWSLAGVWTDDQRCKHHLLTAFLSILQESAVGSLSSWCQSSLWNYQLWLKTWDEALSFPFCYDLYLSKRHRAQLKPKRESKTRYMDCCRRFAFLVPNVIHSGYAHLPMLSANFCRPFSQSNSCTVSYFNRAYLIDFKACKLSWRFQALSSPSIGSICNWGYTICRLPETSR